MVFRGFAAPSPCLSHPFSWEGLSPCSRSCSPSSHVPWHPQQGPLPSLLLNKSQLPASTAPASASPSTFGSFPEPSGSHSLWKSKFMPWVPVLEQIFLFQSSRVVSQLCFLPVHIVHILFYPRENAPGDRHCQWQPQPLSEHRGCFGTDSLP